MTLLRYFLFYFLFTFDVRVMALSEFVHWPPQCRLDQNECVIQWLGQGAKRWKDGSITADLSTGTVVEKGELGQYKLIQGVVRLQGVDVQVQSPFGEVNCRGECEILLRRAPDEFEVMNLNGTALVKFNKKEILVLGEGLLVIMSGVNGHGEPRVSIPMRPSHAYLLRRLKETHLGGDFSERVRPYLAHQAAIADEAASRLEVHIDRQLASLRAQENARLKRLKEQEKERSALRRLFRQKNYLDD